MCAAEIMINFCVIDQLFAMTSRIQEEKGVRDLAE
jgi:hypothetical protein